MQDSPDHFEDPALKAAVIRAWGGERAPAELRNRIQAADASADPAAGRLPTVRRRPWQMTAGIYGLAAAAMVLIAIGIVRQSYRPAVRPTVGGPLAAALPVAMADELVARHDECCRAPDHHMPGLSRTDLPLIASQLRQRLGFPVLAASPPGQWVFCGASVCSVGSTHSGHLLFERGPSQFVSLFSLPRGFVGAALNGATCSQMDEHHPMAGFATSNGFYCIVGSSSDASITLEQIRSIRDRLRPDVAVAQAGTSVRVTVAASR